MTRDVARPGSPSHARVLCLLFVTAFLIRLLYARADPFLHSWDERFHALVARNLMHDPLKPMLIAHPLASYDFRDWQGNHVWLHKQPLFLWQMALSMKLFGVSELALRLPSVFMGSVMVLLLFRIAHLLTANTTVSLLAASLLCFSRFHIELVMGLRGMDHNDVAFGFYVLASIWAYAEYLDDRRWYWAALVGALAGCAILNKWLLGLAVFLGWGVGILASIRRKKTWRDAGDFLLALLVCGLVFVPWQVYIMHKWPNEAKYEYEYNTRHLWEVMEGHGGSVWYYAERAHEFFGHYLWLFIPVGIGVALFSRATNRKLLVPLLAIVTFVFCFFSFAVQTKIMTYVFFVAPLCMIFLSQGLLEVWRLAASSWVRALTFLAGAWLWLDPMGTIGYFSAGNAARNQQIATAGILRSLKAELPADVRVVLNTNALENLDLMFYNNDLSAYPRLSAGELQSLSMQNVAVAVFKSDGRHDLPAYVSAYPHLYVIDRGYAFHGGSYRRWRLGGPGPRA